MTSNKVFIVTGASRGIGLAVSRYLLQHSSQPCNLVVAARTRYPLEELKREFPGRVELVVGRFGDAPPSLSACPSSSTSSTSSSSSSSPASSVPFALEAEVVRTAQSKWGRLDGIVINHATLEPVGRVASDANVEGWQEAFNVNLFSAVALTKAAAPLLRNTKGRIIFTSSGAAVRAYSLWGPYGASKAALNHLALTLAAEEPDITTISIRPGVVDTEMQRSIRETYNEQMDQKDMEKFNSLHKTGKLLSPEQPGHVIAKLVLNAERYLSGQFLSWDDSKLSGY